MAKRKYCIRFQCRSDHPGGDLDDWRSWRRFMVWPMLFDTRKDAEDHMGYVDLFQNMRGLRKVSASVNSVRVKQ
jgi:hypothetical protein